MHKALRKLAARLPHSTQQRIKRHRFAAQLKRGTLGRPRPDLAHIKSLLKVGDWVLDIGANIGEYTYWFSKQVGPSGRVIAVEPVRDTFALLAANICHFPHDNVTLLNVAATDTPAVVGMQVPVTDTGIANYYQAMITTEAPHCQALGIVLDDVTLAHPVAVIKIDAEGHDAQALLGLKALVERDLPVLLLEQVADNINDWLSELGYVAESITGSANTVLTATR